MYANEIHFHNCVCRMYKFKQTHTLVKSPPKTTAVGLAARETIQFQKNKSGQSEAKKTTYGAASCLVCRAKLFPLEHESASGESVR